MGVIARIEKETGVRISARQILLNSLEQLALQCPLPGETAAAGPSGETQPQE